MGRTTRALFAASTLLLALSCGGGRRNATEVEGGSVAFTDVKAAHERFVTARKALAEAEAGEGSVGPEALRAARARFDAAYEQDQSMLAVFLTLALNERPRARETREALGLYAEGAVANARLLLNRGGDPGRAVELLEGAERPFRALGLPLPPELGRAIEDAGRRQSTHPAATGGDPPENGPARD